MEKALKEWTGNGVSAFVQLGASNHFEGQREAHDFYATDPKALELFASRYEIPKNVWEPCCGMGHLSEVLFGLGCQVFSTDLVDRGYGIGGVDFFSLDKALGNSSSRDYAILTNPPYRYASIFCKHALSLLSEGQRLILLLKTTFLEGTGRYREIFEKTPPGIFISTLNV